MTISLPSIPGSLYFATVLGASTASVATDDAMRTCSSMSIQFVNLRIKDTAVSLRENESCSG
jgi:hypothetical protein